MMPSSTAPSAASCHGFATSCTQPLTRHKICFSSGMIRDTILFRIDAEGAKRRDFSKSALGNGYHYFAIVFAIEKQLGDYKSPGVDGVHPAAKCSQSHRSR